MQQCVGLLIRCLRLLQGSAVEEGNLEPRASYADQFQCPSQKCGLSHYVLDLKYIDVPLMRQEMYSET